jgi:hypothetical protein
MGDRANFGFRADGESPVVVLYAHWGGHGMMANLAYAIETARPRWTDHGYATRIAISQLIGDQWDQEYSFGIYVNQIGDNEHSVPVVNWKDKTVSLYEASFTMLPDFDNDTPKFTMGFEAFISRFAKDLVSA